MAAASTHGPNRTTSVGLISDTHGLLRREALDALRGSDFIVHAGDIGCPAILEELRCLAPVTAVRGNNDQGPWAETLPELASLVVQATRILIIHNLKALDAMPASEKVQVVISGHSHRPGYRERDGILFFNPGSAGPRRFRLPVALGRLLIAGQDIVPELHILEPGPTQGG